MDIILLETTEEREDHLKTARERGWDKRLLETTEERDIYLKKAKGKRDTAIQQRNCQSKGFIEDEQQWLIMGSLHTPAEFSSEEDRKKFESQVRSPPGVKESDE